MFLRSAPGCVLGLVLAFQFSTSFSAAQAQMRAVQPPPTSSQGPQAPKVVPYYGKDFFDHVNAGEKDDLLRNELFTILHSDHRHVLNGMDLVMAQCQGQGCYRHVVLGYDRARQFMFGFLYLVQSGNQFGIKDVYCDRVYGPNDFNSRRPAPNQIPDDRVLNAEHTWPQSHFTGRFDREEQKSDLHHLFPSDSHMNSIRSSYPFGNVQNVMNSGDPTCSNSRLGTSAASRSPVFEPPNSHKGHVARAIFYFATRYQSQIPDGEEAALRQWNKQFPPDADEMRHNEEIYRVQGDRNPFIDYPGLADRIQNF